MFSIKDIRPAISQSWNLISTQDWQGLMVRLNTSGTAFSGVGLGGSTATSTAVLVDIAGSADQRVTATLRYSSPTTDATCNMGVILRVKSLQNSGDTNYYYARVHQGVAKITPVVAGTLGSALSQSAFVLPADTDVTITFSAIGSALSASFRASGVPDVDLSAVDTQITGNGFIGFRSTSQTVFCSAISAELF